MTSKVQRNLIENKAHHHVAAVLISFAIAVILLELHEQETRSEQNTKTEYAAAEAQVAGLKTTVLAAQARYQADKEREGFFRRYLWSDSPLVKADLGDIKNVDLQYEMAQENACKIVKEANCSVVMLETQDRSGVLIHRIKVVAIVASTFLTFVIIMMAIGGIVLTFPTGVGPIVIFSLTCWYLFH